MTVYMVERNLKGIAIEQLAAAQQAAITTAGEMTMAGTAVRYIRSIFAPDDGRCMCLFEAGSDTSVRQVNDRAGIPYDRVVIAMDLTPR
jgi:hypothetical protein